MKRLERKVNEQKEAINEWERKDNESKAKEQM